MQEAPPAAHPLDTPSSDAFTPNHMDRLLSDFRDQPSLFEEKVNEYVAFNWPHFGRETFDDVVIQFEHFQPDGEGQMRAASPDSNDRQAKGDPSWNQLVDCFNSALRRGQIVYNVDIPPGNGGATPFRETVLQSIQEEQEIAEPEENPSETVLSGSDSDFYPVEMTASLMGGVDLHMELQNYLKAIEGFQTAKTKTKNTLQCNFYDNYVPLKLYSSSQDLQKRAEEYFDVSENRSGTSFDSATSDCPQLEEVTNEMLLNLTAVTGPEPTARRASKAEADPGKQQQQQQPQKLKSSIKRTAGITPHQVFKLDDKTTWGPSYLHGEYIEHTGGLSHDDYEKIQPIGAAVTRRKSKIGLLFQNPVTRTEESQESAPGQDQTPPWSPTLQELIDIYNSVLKQNTKIKRNSKQSVQRCFSTHLFTFLNEKLRERHYKSDLLNLSKDFRIDCKTLTKLGKPAKNNNDLMKVEEYVEMFQEILHSSLSIQQITRLNNMLAGLQDYSQKNYNYVKDLKEEAKKQSKEQSPVLEEKREPSPTVPTRPKTAPRKPVKTLRFEMPPKPVKPVSRTPRPTTAERKIRKQKPRKPKPKPVKPPILEKIEKTELAAPAELESILKLCSKGIVLEKQDMSEEKRKILLTVKLQGNQVLVNGISRFNSESALMNEKPDSKGTSELIIENVTKRKMSSDVWWKNTKSSRLRIQNQENTRKRLKKPKKVTTRLWKRNKSTDSDSEHSEQEKPKQEFEYDQVRLRVQHPIDAIAEISESKVSQQVESLEEQRKGEPPPETKILLQDIPDSPKAMKEALKAVLDQKVFTKDFIWDFGWSEEELGKTVTRKRSFRSKRRPTPKKSNHAVEVKSLGDLKKKPNPAKAKGQKPPRRGRTYLCYSSLQSIQGKASRKTQRQTTRNGSPAKSKSKNKVVCDKASKETQLSEKKSEPASSVLFKTTALDNPQSSVDVSTNSDEVEFIFTEEHPDAGSTAQESQTVASFDSAASLEKEDSFLTAEKESSVALLQSSPCNDCVSILHQMNLSDSFLGNIPASGVSHSKLRSLFQCSSDLKFYPGRVTESGTAEENPIVTFVLTPSQHEQAQLPENQVKIVRKNGAGPPKDSEKKTEEIPEPSTEEGRDEISLKSIEEFINYLSKCRKMADSNRKKRSKPQPEEKKLESSSAKCCAGYKPPGATSRLSGSSLPFCRNGFHDCQKKPAPSESNKKKPEKPGPAPKKKAKPKKKPESPDRILNKLVDHLSRALENLRDEKLKQKESQQVETAKPSENHEKKETNTESKKADKAPVDSVKPGEILPEVVEAIKIAITQTEGSREKQEKTTEVGDGLCKVTQNVGTTCEEVPKKVKALKIKIHCNEAKRPSEDVVQPSPQVKEVHPAGEIELLDSLVSRDTEGGDLKRQNSTYFDAVEKNQEVKMSGDTNNQPTVEGKLNLSVEFGVKEQPKHTLFTPSDEQLLSREVLGKNSEEIIYNKIAKAFQEGHVTYSMALLEAFLSKADDSDCVRLRRLLALVETRSRNIMMNMERAAWQKVLSLLEEVSQVVGKDDDRDSMNAQLETAKHFIDKIQLLNTRRLTDLQNFCSSFVTSQKEDDTHRNNVMDRIKQSLKHLKEKFTLQRNNPSRNLENMDRSELRDSGSGFRIHSTVSLPELREDKVTRADNAKDSQELKRRLQQRYFCMQELLTERDKSERENIPQEIQDVRDRVAEKIRLLESALEGSSRSEASRESSTYWTKATSLLRLATGCRREEGGSGASGEVRLDRRPGYVDLMKCLMKAWDTRMTIGTIKSECFG